MPHTHVDPTFLILSVATLGVGPLLLAGTARRAQARHVVEVVVMVSVAGLVLLEVLPECVHVAGGAALVVAAIGLAVPLVTDRFVHAAGRDARRVVVWLATLALGAHAITDGLALAGAGGHVHGHGDGLGLAIVLHHVPEGAAVWWLLRGRGRSVAVLALAAVAACTVAGFALGEALLPFVDGRASALFQAFVGGVLIHVLAHRGGERVTSSMPWALGGVLAVVAVRPLLDGGGHTHEHHGGSSMAGLLALAALLLGLPILRGLFRHAPALRRTTPTQEGNVP